MKRILALVLVFLSLTSVAFAANIDLSGMSYAELVELKDQINLAMWNSKEWQEVTVPQGVWKVGEDIPAGHWMISASNKSYVMISYGSKLDESKKGIDWFSSGMIMETLVGQDHIFASEDSLHSIDIEMVAGYYFVVEDGTVVFTPYTGKPSLGFK